jgi:hypothetical protein
MRYDPSVAPNAKAWLAMDEGERVESVREYHRRRRIRLPNLDAHAVAHAVIENQLAEGLVQQGPEALGAPNTVSGRIGRDHHKRTRRPSSAGISP